MVIRRDSHPPKSPKRAYVVLFLASVLCLALIALANQFRISRRSDFVDSVLPNGLPAGVSVLNFREAIAEVRFRHLTLRDPGNAVMGAGLSACGDWRAIEYRIPSPWIEHLENGKYEIEIYGDCDASAENGVLFLRNPSEEKVLIIQWGY